MTRLPVISVEDFCIWAPSQPALSATKHTEVSTHRRQRELSRPHNNLTAPLSRVVYKGVLGLWSNTCYKWANRLSFRVPTEAAFFRMKLYREPAS